MIYCNQPIDAIFVKKLNRFLGIVKIGGKEHKAHIPNSGRLFELFTEGRRAILSKENGSQRKTAYTVRAVWYNRRWVCVDSMAPNRLIERMALGGKSDLFSGYENVQREYSVGRHRFDLLLSGGSKQPTVVEIKSVTLVRENTALFSDAPTIRGAAHMSALGKLTEEGYRCMVLFCVLRSDASRFMPNTGTDPVFSRELKLAKERGVDVRAVRCRVGRRSTSVIGEIPVELG